MHCRKETVERSSLYSERDNHHITQRAESLGEQRINKQAADAFHRLNESIYRTIMNGNLKQLTYMLIFSGVDLKMLKFANSLTPLHVAVIHNQIAIAEFLVTSTSVDIETKDISGRTAMDWALLSNNSKMIELLQHEYCRRGLYFEPKDPSKDFDTASAPLPTHETGRDFHHQYEASLLSYSTSSCIGDKLNFSPDDSNNQDHLESDTSAVSTRKQLVQANEEYGDCQWVEDQAANIDYNSARSVNDDIPASVFVPDTASHGSMSTPTASLFGSKLSPDVIISDSCDVSVTQKRSKAVSFTGRISRVISRNLGTVNKSISGVFKIPKRI